MRTVVVALTLLLCSASSTRAAERVDFRARTLQGDSLHLADFRGHVVVVDFWATWCPPCRKQLPKLAALEKQVEDVVVLAVCVDTRADKIEAFSQRLAVPRRILWDAQGALANQFDVQAMPWTVLIDQQGRIVRQGAPSPQESAEALVAEVRQLQSD